MHLGIYEKHRFRPDRRYSTDLTLADLLEDPHLTEQSMRFPESSS
jgi:hypothetical protein